MQRPILIMISNAIFLMEFINSSMILLYTFASTLACFPFFLQTKKTKSILYSVL